MLYRIILTIKFRGDLDFTKHLALIGLVSGFEVWFGIIIACLPTLAPLVRLNMGKFRTGSSGSRPSGYSATTIPLKIFGTKNRTPGRYDQISSNSQARLNNNYEGAQQLDTEPGVTTEVTYDPRNLLGYRLTDPNKIYVRSEIESRVWYRGTLDNMGLFVYLLFSIMTAWNECITYVPTRIVNTLLYG